MNNDYHPITTYTGIVIRDIDNVPLEQINILDIAHGLAGVTRWAGQRWITDAEHSIIVMNLVKKYDDRFQKAPPMRVYGSLMHDSEEAYRGDIISGIKVQFPEIAKKGERLQRKIEARFGIELTEEDHRIIKECDLAARSIELAMTKFMTREEAKIAFLEAFLGFVKI